VTPERILIDTDPGIDDALAFLLALASPEVHVEGISGVGGNCTMEMGYENARRVLDLAHAGPIPVTRGAVNPLIQPLIVADETHGPTGMGYAELPLSNRPHDPRRGAEFIIETVLASPGEITIVAIGPLTNLALAIRLEPKIVPAIKHVVSMGGAIHFPGNVTALAEFNVWCDPHAAHIVYHAGMPLSLVPLDVTYQCVLTPKHIARIKSLPSPVSRFLIDSTRFYLEYHDEYQKIEGCVINDPLALALVYMPDLVTWEEHPVDVDHNDGVSIGKTFSDDFNYNHKPNNMRVAMKVRANDFMEHFVTRMETLCKQYPD